MTLLFDSIPVDSQFNHMPYLPEYKTRIFSLSSEKWEDSISSHTKLNMFCAGIFLKIEDYVAGSSCV
jgi:hypothetical protein